MQSNDVVTCSNIYAHVPRLCERSCSVKRPVKSVGGSIHPIKLAEAVLQRQVQQPSTWRPRTSAYMIWERGNIRISSSPLAFPLLLNRPVLVPQS